MYWALVALGSVELALWAAFAFGFVTGGAALGGHAVALAAALALTLRGSRQDSARLIAAMLATAAGPVGAFAAAALLGLRDRHPRGQMRDDGWIDLLSAKAPVDPAEDLFLKIRSGQALQPNRTLPRHFDKVLSVGTTRDQQALLGLVAQSFHPSFQHLLDNAVQSSNPWVRVQAAAAFTALRNRERALLDKSTAPGNTAASLLADLTRLAGSPLISEQERHLARQQLLGRFEVMLGELGSEDGPIAERARLLVRAGLFPQAARLLQRKGPVAAAHRPALHADGQLP